ncbi:MAG: protein kinase [Chloroflexi bacterium]|nr:protein kinase [Chloroflexota bacterium]
MIAQGNLIGRRLGAYHVAGLLGSGGMASVYRGYDVNLQRPVAIKVLSNTTDPELVQRFRREALLLASLRHPNIVPIYFFGEEGGYLFMVQELLPGPTLEQKLQHLAAQGGHMPKEEILTVVRDIAAALDAAHVVGVIHRDVKPGNIIWNAANVPVLTDFGIAKSATGGPNLTASGMTYGTPGYVSPEQARGQTLTAATDIYSLGVVLYELITGHPPFTAPSPMEVVLQHIQAWPEPMKTFRVDVPADVEAVVQRAMAKDPSARYSRATDMAAALEQAWPDQAAAEAASALDIYNQPTQVWKTTAILQRGMGRVVPIFIAAVLLLLGGSLVALLSGRSAGATLAPSAAQTTLTPIQTRQPPDPTHTAIPAPTATPPSRQVSLPVSQPPAVPASPLSQLRDLLEAGVNDGRIGKDGKELILGAGELQQALATGNGKKAADIINDLQERLIDGVEEGKIELNLAQRAINLLNQIAGSNNLVLPPGHRGKGKGKDD